MRTFLSISILFFSATAAADDVVTAPVEVKETRPAEAQAEQAERALDEPSFVTVVPIDRHRDETVSVAEALAETVGVSVRSLGGLGSFASISMRGAPAGQTEILVDGVPLSRFAFSSVDVGSLDLAGFDRIEITRGGVPAEVGGAVLGGAVDFVTAVGPAPGAARTAVTAGGGSFGSRHARVTRRDALGALRATISAGYEGATGSFDYFDDNGTPLNRADDATRTRQNNGFDSAFAAARLAAGDVAGGARFYYKDQGVPGTTETRAEHARLTTARVLGDARGKKAVTPELTLGARAYGLFEAQRFTDPDAEVSLVMADTRFRTGAGGLVLSGDLIPSPRHRLSAALEGTVDLFSQRDPSTAGASSGHRVGGAAALADEIVLGADEQVVLIPGVRVDVLATRGSGPPATVIGAMAPDAHDDVFFSPRVAARWRATADLTFKANAGRYFRPPTVVELFGNRGFLAGNATLRPETGFAGDAGVVLAPASALGPIDRLYLESAFFAAQVSDLIAFLPTSARVARAGNLSDARLWGVEAVVAARAFRTLDLTANYTFLDSRQRSPRVAIDGKRLPGRPRHELFLRADVARRVAASVVVGGFADLTLVSGNYLDEGNINEVPARRFVGAGVRVAPASGLSIVLECKNLTDVRVEEVAGGFPRAVADILDYPLPGRAFHATVDWSF
jgi:outer membrane receptor protein involved in Fe transport